MKGAAQGRLLREEIGLPFPLSHHSSLRARCGVSPTFSISAPTGARPTRSSVQTVSSFSARATSLIAHGVWLQTEYGLTPSALGLVALFQGAADLAGAVLVSLITDRVGKKRSFQAGILGSALVYSFLPVVNIGLWPVIAALLLMRFTYEYGLVSAIALVSEQAPDRRGKVISLAVAINLLGVTLTGFTGPWMYTHFGVWGLGPVSAVCTLAAFMLLTVWGREPAGTAVVSG